MSDDESYRRINQWYTLIDKASQFYELPRSLYLNWKFNDTLPDGINRSQIDTLFRKLEEECFFPEALS
jgi:hypothetical protein